MPKRVFIIHGWEGTPRAHWFPWLKRELEERGFQVQAPAMPHPKKPKLAEWLAHLEKMVGQADENTYFVGHSLGVITILRFLESIPHPKKVGGAVLVAGFSKPIGYKELNSFFVEPVDYHKIKNSVNKIVAIHSDNDPYVLLENGEILRDNLGAKLIIIPLAGHLNQEDGFNELPIALESLLEIAGYPKKDISD